MVSVPAGEEDRNAAVAAAVARLSTEGAPQAVAFLLAVLRDRSESTRLRVDVAKTILDRAGVIPPRASDAPDAVDKPLHRRSRGELAALIERAQSELSGRARVVNARQTGVQTKRTGAELLA